MRYSLVLLTLVFLLSSCGSPASPISSGIWQATYTPDPGQSLPATPDTTHLYEINFGSSTIQGFHYACDAGWVKCAPTGFGLPLTGTISKGAADFSFSYKDSPPTTVQITGTFTTGGFSGRFKKTAPGSSTLVGAVTMVWVQSQR